MKVKDLDKEDYFVYSSCMANAENSYTSSYWMLLLVVVLGTISIAIEPTILGYVMVGLMLLTMIFSYAVLVSKMQHIRKLFGIEKGFSLLN